MKEERRYAVFGRQRPFIGAAFGPYPAGNTRGICAGKAIPGNRVKVLRAQRSDINRLLDSEASELYAAKE
jgi:hypothetical protein